MLAENIEMTEIKMLIHRLNSKRVNDATSIALMAKTPIESNILIPEICYLFKRIFNLEECGFFWSDADGGFLDAWLTTPHLLSSKVLQACLDYQGTAPNIWPSFKEHVNAGPVCGYYLPFLNQSFYESTFFKATYQPINAFYICDLVIHDGIRPYGYYLMLRSKPQGAFTDSERNFMRELIPVLRCSFSNPKSMNTLYSLSKSTGSAILAKSGVVKHLDSVASSIVWMLANDKKGAFANPESPSLMTYLTMLSEPYIKHILSGEKIRFSIENRWGRFVLKFELQSDSHVITAQLTQQIPLTTELVKKLHYLDLTPMQKMVGFLLALNKPRQEIADALCVSLETVTTHIKAIYRATNTKSSHALLLSFYQ